MKASVCRRSLVLASTLAAMLLSAAVVLAGEHDVDNSATNARDREDRTLTPGDQGGSTQDREVTANVRQAIVQDDTLSMDAQNVKIITQDGVVTLRGTVESASEKVSVAAKAQRVAGVKRVDNQLEIEEN